MTGDYSDEVWNLINSVGSTAKFIGCIQKAESLVSLDEEIYNRLKAKDKDYAECHKKQDFSICVVLRFSISCSYFSQSYNGLNPVAILMLSAISFTKSSKKGSSMSLSNPTWPLCIFRLLPALGNRDVYTALWAFVAFLFPLKKKNTQFFSACPLSDSFSICSRGYSC